MNPTQPLQQAQQPLDTSIVNLAKAIGKTESGGNYDAVGKSGEKGAYQFMPETWKSWAGTHLGDPNAPLTKENQDKVVYKQIESWGKQGYKPSQIASLWNSGKPQWEGNVGVNSKGVKFDTPQYVNSVGKYYDELQKGGNPSVIPTASTVQQESRQEPQEKTLGQELKGRLTDATGAIGDTLSRKINPLSGVIQTAGAAAGALGDVIGKGIELIPGVKKIESLIGQGVGSLMSTPVGQSVAKAVKDFSTAHPELADDIGAGFNIVTAIPILKGLGVVKDVALTGVGKALESAAEKGAVKDLTKAFSRTKTLNRAFEINGGENTIKEAVSRRLLPDIQDGRYSTQEAFTGAEKIIDDIENKELQPALAKASTQLVSDRQPIDAIREDALKGIREEFKSSGNVKKAEAEVNRVFDDYKGSYGDYATLQDINDMKRGIRKSVNFNSPKLESDVTYHIGQAFQRNIEDKAALLGLGDIAQINQRMAALIKYQNMLQKLEGTPLKLGKVSGLLRRFGTEAGAFGGGLISKGIGLPETASTFIGGASGRSLGKSAGGISRSLRNSILSRTGEGAKTLSGKEIRPKIAGLLASDTINRKTRR